MGGNATLSRNQDAWIAKYISPNYLERKFLIIQFLVGKLILSEGENVGVEWGSKQVG